MANAEHLEILKSGAEVWNKWRKENSDLQPDLTKANLSGINFTETQKRDVTKINPSPDDLVRAKRSRAFRAMLFAKEIKIIFDLSKVDLSEANLTGADLSLVTLSGAKLHGVNLSSADLSYADLRGADFSNAKLSNVNLYRASLGNANLWRVSLHGANLSEANLAEVNLSRAKLNRSQLSNALLAKSNLSNAELSGAILSGTDLSNAKLINANLSGTILCEANLSNADLTGANLSGAKLSLIYLFEVEKPIDLSRYEIPTAEFLSRVRPSQDDYDRDVSDDLSGVFLYGATLLNANFTNVNLSRADLVGCNLVGANLTGINLKRANLSNADLSNANLSGAKLSDANLSNTNLSHANLSDAKLFGVNLQNAKLPNANLSKAVLINANLSSANLGNSDISNSNLSGANLTNSNLTEANLSDADLSDANLTNANLYRAVFKNCTIGRTIFGLTNIGMCLNLDTVKVEYPCIIDFQFLRAVKDISKSFLLKIGLPELFINHLRESNKDVLNFYPVFLSHSWANKDFARKLYEALIEKGVNVFFYKKKMKSSDDIYESISKGIEHYDKMILVCSKESLSESRWVDRELDRILKKERDLFKERGKRINLLIPIMIDDYVFQWNGAKSEEVRRYVIGDFKDWKDESKFEKALGDLVHVLNADRPDVKPKSLL